MIWCSIISFGLISAHFKEIYDLLQASNEGRTLLSSYRRQGVLDIAARRKLCSLIINKELQNDAQKGISSTRLHSLAHEITHIFPNKEHVATYFILYISFGPGLKRAAKRKLHDCLQNRRREYRRSGIIQALPRASYSSSESSSSGPSTPISLETALLPLREGLLRCSANETTQAEQDVEENLQWLRSSSDPWQTLEDNWRITNRQRLKKLFTASDNQSAITNYLNEFPALKKSLGYLLVSIQPTVCHTAVKALFS